MSRREVSRASVLQKELDVVNRKSYREGFAVERLAFLNISGNPDTSFKENLIPKRTLMPRSLWEGT